MTASTIPSSLELPGFATNHHNSCPGEQKARLLELLNADNFYQLDFSSPWLEKVLLAY
ncbi:MAG: hypothetical protein GX564_10280, partial [Oligosphaeraceae bacterium]|nr:hypothetical protein [Oligosphaeraceae bacterium]